MRCCPGSSSGPINCCGGWRIRSYATNGLAVPTRDAAPPAAKAGWSRHLKPVVVVLEEAIELAMEDTGDRVYMTYQYNSGKGVPYIATNSAPIDLTDCSIGEIDFGDIIPANPIAVTDYQASTAQGLAAVNAYDGTVARAQAEHGTRDHQWCVLVAGHEDGEVLHDTAFDVSRVRPPAGWERSMPYSTQRWVRSLPVPLPSNLVEICDDG